MICASAKFIRHVGEDVQHIDGHFTSHPQHVSSGRDYDIDQLRSKLDVAVDNFNARGSGFNIDIVTDFTVVLTLFRPLSGSSYIPTPPSIVKKHAVVNVQNRDLYCFRWSILSCLYPAKHHPYRVSNYTKYENILNFEGINFSVQVKDISKFEKQNPDISVNVISLDPDKNKDKTAFCIEYLSPERQHPHHVNLLLLSDTNTAHYVWIKHFSRLLGDRTDHNTAYVCNSCLNVFSSQRILNEHTPYCLQHPAQQTSYPSPHDCKLTFKDQDKQHPLKFYLVSDFESFLVPATSRE